jgi:hypothetical protein
MKKIAVLGLVLLLSACSTVVTRVEGEQRLAERLSLKLPQAWNKFEQAKDVPYELWTQEGPLLDQLRLWVALKPEQALTPKLPNDSQKAAKLPVFNPGLRPDQWVGLLEAAYAVDGSVVNVDKVEPSTLGGLRAVRFEFSMTRKSDELSLLGVGWATEQDQRFYAAVFTAPRLHFYGALLPQVQSLMQTARFTP